MSQNVIALIIFLSLVALAVVGTLVFSALVDRSVKRERSAPGSAGPSDTGEDAAGVEQRGQTGDGPDEPASEREERR